MKRFLQIAGAFMLPVVLVAAVFLAALLRCGELAPTPRVVRDTLDGKVSLFGLAYRYDTRPYKRDLAAANKAAVLVLGTSRSMQFRGGFFETDSFYNAGGGIAYLPQCITFLRNLPDDALPENLVLVLDQYFFNQKWASSDPDRDTEYVPYVDPDFSYAYKKIMNDYLDKKFSLRAVFTAPDTVRGLFAASRAAGFYPDGSYSYGTDVLHPEESADAGFADTYSRIARDTQRFEYGDEASAEMLAALEELLAYCSEKNIAVTAILPPYAPSVWQTMLESGNYGYIERLYETLAPVFAAHGCEVFDYTYLAETSDEMYIDGFHGSDRVYAAICARLAEDSALLDGLFDKARLTQLFSGEGNPLTVALPDA